MSPGIAAGGLLHGHLAGPRFWVAGTIRWALKRVHSGFHLSAPTPYDAPALFWKPVSALTLFFDIASVSADLTSLSSLWMGNVVASAVSSASRSTILA